MMQILWTIRLPRLDAWLSCIRTAGVVSSYLATPIDCYRGETPEPWPIGRALPDHKQATF